MTFAVYKPQEWSARILETLKDAHVYASLLNRDYEGDIRNSGDSVRIRTVGRPTVAAYTPYSTTITPEQIMGADLVLKVDQAQYFAISVDDIDKRQADIDILNKLTAEAAWAFADVIDADIATVLADGVATANQLTAVTNMGVGVTDTEAYTTLVNLRQELNVANVPQQGRWVVVPPQMESLLLQDPRFVSFGTGPNISALTNGKIGRVAGFDIHVSNNVPLSSTTYTLIAGTNSAASYVEQINKMEPYRPQDAFEDAIKGLLLYGRKVVMPNGLASVDVDFS
jgi:N4-gp56 family major capsid protein